MNVLVIGGTGNIGQHVTRGLLDRGETVRVLTRSAAHVEGLPEGARVAVGDLADPASLRSAFEGVDSVFMVTPLHPDETEFGLNAVNAAGGSGVRRMVYSSVMMPPGSEAIPHFGTKVPIEDAIKASDFEWTILRPTNFYQNDLTIKEAMLSFGVYAQPLGEVGVNRVDVRDIADAAVSALLSEGHAGRSYGVGGPEDFTGDQTAEIWSRRLGKEIVYIGDDLDVWAAQAGAFLPTYLVRDLEVMYEYFQTYGFPLPESAREPLRQLLGHDPRTFEAFTAEVAPAWKSEMASAKTQESAF